MHWGIRALVLSSFACFLGLAASFEASAAPDKIIQVTHQERAAEPTLGPALAPVTIEFFFDVADPQSVVTHRLLQIMRARHPERLRVRYRVTGRGGRSNRHLAVALESHRQGLFFPFLNKLYGDNQPNPRRADLEAVSRGVGLDVDRLDAAVRDDAHEAIVRGNYYLGRRYRIRSSPSLLINGRAYSAHEPQLRVLDALEAAYDEGLTRARMLQRRGVPRTKLAEALRREMSLDLPLAPPQAGRTDQPRKNDEKTAFPVKAGPPSRTASTRGPDTPAVTLTFYCRFLSRNCMSQNSVIDEIRSAYSEEVQIVFEPLLPALADAESVFRSHEAALCAAEQGAFWVFYDHVFSQFQRLRDNHGVEQWGSALGLDGAALKACVATGRFRAPLVKGRSRARRLGISRTPTLVLGGRAYVGTQSFEVLRGLVDRELAPGLLERYLPRSPR